MSPSQTHYRKTQSNEYFQLYQWITWLMSQPGIFKRHILVVHTRWQTLTSPSLSPLSTTRNTRNNTGGNQRRTPNTEKRRWVGQSSQIRGTTEQWDALGTPDPTEGYPGPESPNCNLAVVNVGGFIPPLHLTGGPANNSRWSHSTGRGNPTTTSSGLGRAFYPCRPKKSLPVFRRTGRHGLGRLLPPPSGGISRVQWEPRST